MFEIFKQIDATIIVAGIALIGTIVTILSTKGQKKQDSILEANKQLMEMVTLLQEQHAKESQRLEKKITELTQENQELREQVTKLNNYLIKLGINV